MSYSKPLTITTALLGFTLSIGSTLSLAQNTVRPDLSGVWTNSSRTGLTRPRGIDTLVVSGERAEEIVANMSIAGISAENVAAGPAIDPETGAPPAGGQDFGLRGYNLFWTDPGESLALVKGEFRTSYIVNPENGQVPRLATPKVDLNRPQYGARYFTGVGDASGPEAIPIAERCLLGFGNTAGPGMMGTLYNSSYQFVQTDDYVLINVEMVHDSRIIPIFDTPEERCKRTRVLPSLRSSRWLSVSAPTRPCSASSIPCSSGHSRMTTRRSWRSSGPTSGRICRRTGSPVRNTWTCRSSIQRSKPSRSSYRSR